MTRDSENLASAARLRAIDALCDRFEGALPAGSPRIDDYLAEAPAELRGELLVELAAIELQVRRQGNDGGATWAELLARYPALADELLRARGEIEAAAAEDSALAATAAHQAFPQPAGLHVRCPHCSHPVELVADTPHDDVTCRECGSTFCLVDRDDALTPMPQMQQVGRFELLARLGVGGFGTVWKARDPELDRLVAIKIPRRGQLRAEEAELFFREARAAAQLRHPNIVPVYEIGRHDDVIYIVSGLVEGTTLADWMTVERHTPREAAAMAVEIAEALHFAHEQGIVHRDLKPSNVMVDHLQRPQLMDFGLAKREAGEATMTMDGQIIGTAAYMSPEQAAGKAHWTDRRADVYSLGVMLFQMATGELPFRGNFEAQVGAKLRDDAPNPRTLNPRVPRDYATVALKCLERDPNSRYATAKGVADELRRMLAGEPIRARPISSFQRAVRWAKRRPAAAIALALAATLAVAGPIAALTIDRQRRELVAKRDELIELVAKEQAGKRRLEESIAELRREFAVATGRDAAPAKIEPWRTTLATQILAARPVPEVGEKNAEQQACRALADGMLLAEAGRSADAAERFAIAKRALARLVEQQPDGTCYLAALADCCEQLAQAHRAAGNATAAQAAVDEAVRFRRRLAALEPNAASRAVDELAAHYQALPAAAKGDEIAAALSKVPALSKEILDRWPTTPQAEYEAACRLTGREPLLLLPGE